MLHAEKGQATVAALVLMPLVLSLFLAVAGLAYVFSIEAKTTAACRTSLMESQAAAAEALENLLRLNPDAVQAETTRQIADASLKMALTSGFPFAIIAAEAALLAAEAHQAIVAGRQQFWLMKGHFASSIAATRALGAARDALPTESFESALADFSFPQLQHAKFAVIPSSLSVRTPTYRTAPNFEKLQNARVRWLLKPPLPSRLSTFFESPTKTKEFKLKFEAGCAASLRKQGNGRWVPQITEDKLLLN